MERSLFAACALTAAAITLVSNSTTSAMTAQEFFAAETKGEYSSPQQKRNLQRTQMLQQRQEQLQAQQQERTEQQQQRARIPVPSQAQQISVAQPAALSGLNIGGSWLAANMGAVRPSGAPGAWCGYAMRLEMVSQGYGDPGPEFNHVSHWCRVGSAAPVGAVGSIFVSRGHVSKVVAGNCPTGTVATISGNATGRRVSHMCEPVSRAVCSRWPGKVNS